MSCLYDGYILDMTLSFHQRLLSKKYRVLTGYFYGMSLFIGLFIVKCLFKYFLKIFLNFIFKYIHLILMAYQPS